MQTGSLLPASNGSANAPWCQTHCGKINTQAISTRLLVAKCHRSLVALLIVDLFLQYMVLHNALHKDDEKSWMEEIKEPFYMTTTLPPSQCHISG